MEKRILSYDEYTSKRKTVAESKGEESSDKLNEGFLDAIVRFFKGMFDLFSNKRLKSESEESSKYFKELTDNDEISDEDLAEEIDMKRVRRSTEKSINSVRERVDVEKEKGVKTSADLVKGLASWFAQIITIQDTIMKMPAIQKMLKNNDLRKRFDFVPSNFTEKGIPTREWYTQKDCEFDKNMAAELTKALSLPIDKQDEAIKAFSRNYVEFIAKKLNIMDKVKTNDADALDQLYGGFAAMTIGVVQAMQNMMKNTPDDKAAEIIAEEIIQERKRKPKKTGTEKPEEKVDTKEEDATASSRVRKGTRKTSTSSKPSATTKKKPTVKDTSKKEPTA